MKKILINLFLLITTMSKAQFNPAIIAPSVGTNSVAARTINCDIITGSNNTVGGVSTTNIRVSAIVNDGSSPYLFSQGYNTTTSTILNTNSILLTCTDALYPDVCLVSKQGYIWALVLCESPSRGIVLETFLWDNTSYLFTSIALQTLSTQHMRTAVHIDSDRNDYWIGTWDEGGSQTIHTCIGRTHNNSSGPYLISSCGSGNVELDFPTNLPSTVTSLTFPDVAVYANTNSSVQSVEIYYTYLGIDPSGSTNEQNLAVQNYRIVSNVFTDICNGNVGSTTSVVDVIDRVPGTTTTQFLFNPRIATHHETNSSTTYQTGFVVVYAKVDNSSGYIADIMGRNYWCSSTSNCYYTPALSNPANNYTNNSLAFWNTSILLQNLDAYPIDNILPVVTLDRYTGTYNNAPTNNGNDVIVAWNYHRTSVAYPVMLYVNVETGQPQVPPLFNGSVSPYNFNNISTITTGAQTGIAVSSESGQTKDILYAWWNDGSYDILYKIVHSGLDLRLAGNAQNSYATVWLTDILNQGIQLSPDIDGQHLHITLTDTKGATYLKINGDVNQANDALRSISHSLAPGMYMFNLQTASQIYRCKVIKP